MGDADAALDNAAQAAVRLRITRGLDIESAARLAALDVERLEAFEDGLCALELDELERLAGAYDVNVAEFFGARRTPIQNYASG